jgi:hypothetical protein
MGMMAEMADEPPQKIQFFSIGKMMNVIEVH